MLMSFRNLVLSSAALCATAAFATEQKRVEVPFDFVASGKTLPAGTYKVGRLSGDRLSAQLLRNRDNSVAVFVNPVAAETSYVDMPVVRFQQVGNQFFLSSIQTEDDIFNFQISRSANQEAAARSINNVAISGVPTSN